MIEEINKDILQKTVYKKNIVFIIFVLVYVYDGGYPPQQNMISFWR